MADDGDLLDPADPFLSHVRRAAARDRRAFDWLIDSATAWARGEFIRRVGGEDVTHDRVDRLLAEAKGRQVAVLTVHLQLGATRDNRLNLAKRSRWTVHIGVLIDGQMPSGHDYLNLDKGVEKMAGIFDVMDVFALPEPWRVEPWPKFYEERGTTLRPPADAARGVTLHKGDSITLTHTVGFA